MNLHQWHPSFMIQTALPRLKPAGEKVSEFVIVHGKITTQIRESFQGFHNINQQVVCRSEIPWLFSGVFGVDPVTQLLNHAESPKKTQHQITHPWLPPKIAYVNNWMAFGSWFHGHCWDPWTLGIRIQLPYVLDAFFPSDRGPRTVTVFRRGHWIRTGGDQTWIKW